MAYLFFEGDARFALLELDFAGRGAACFAVVAVDFENWADFFAFVN